MARFRFRRAARRAGRGFKRFARRSAKGQNTMGMMLGAAVYGAVREKASNMLAPVASKLPLGNISDEVALGGLAWIVRKKVSNPMVRNVATAALLIESARIGEALIGGSLGLGGSSDVSSSSW